MHNKALIFAYAEVAMVKVTGQIVQASYTEEQKVKILIGATGFKEMKPMMAIAVDTVLPPPHEDYNLKEQVFDVLEELIHEKAKSAKQQLDKVMMMKAMMDNGEENPEAFFEKIQQMFQQLNEEDTEEDTED